MSSTTSKGVLKKPAQATAGSVVESPALQWLWKYLGDVPHPHILDCGEVKPQTVDILLSRGAKVFVADLVTPVQRDEPSLWDRSRKVPVFLAEDYVAKMPVIPIGSLNVIFCWHLLDLLPRQSLQTVMERLFPCLQPGGVLFCLLREPYLRAGAESKWWLESLTGLTAGGEGKKLFSYQVLTGRDVERLVPSASLKSFLTRSGRREVLVLK